MQGSADSDKSKRLRKRLLGGLLIVVLAVAMAGWIAALGWIAYLLIWRML